MGCLITYPMSIYSCFAFDKGSEFARLQTVKEQSAIVDTFPYMYPHPSASAFATVSEQRRCKGTNYISFLTIINQKLTLFERFLLKIIVLLENNDNFAVKFELSF